MRTRGLWLGAMAVEAEVLWSCCIYTLILTLFLPNVEKTNSVTIKVSVNIGLGMVCKQLRSQKKKWLC